MTNSRDLLLILFLLISVSAFLSLGAVELNAAPGNNSTANNSTHNNSTAANSTVSSITIENNTTSTTTPPNNSSNYTLPEYARGGSTDFLCQKYTPSGKAVNPGDPNYSIATYDPVVYMLQRIVGLFMVAGPVAGIIVGLYATIAGVLRPAATGDSSGGKYAKTRRNAIIVGFGTPLMAYGSNVIVDQLFDMDVSCIIPGI